jgi:cytochrome c oxidase subunit 2
MSPGLLRLLRFVFPEQASTLAPRVDALLSYLIALTVFFVALVAGLILVFMVRYRRRAEEIPPVVHGSLALEAAWTIVPFGMIMVVFFWGASVYVALQRAPDDAIQVNVVGKQWMWKVQHMEGRREINELHVPVGRPVRLVLTAEDVIHSFYVPAFRTKQDALPGRYTTLWFEATKPGWYHLFCAEYCGTLHSGMIGRVVAMEPADFQAWLAGGGAGGPESLPVAEAGAIVFQEQGCVSCHRSEPHARGPALAGVFGSTVRLADGRTVTADAAYVRESILDPRAKVVAGFEPLMPTYQGILDEEAVMQLIEYVKALAPGQGGER